LAVTITQGSRHGKPGRYTRLIEYFSSKLGNPTARFDVALRRIESRRLLAEDKLRRVLLSYWSKPFEELKVLCPLDILYSFQEYAEAALNAAGEEFVAIFEDPGRYRSFLYVAVSAGLKFPKNAD
jgi:hypothetical protein